MSSIKLNPNDVNVLSSFLLFNQFQQNSENLTLQTGITNGNNPSSLLLDGSSRAYLTGQVNVTSGASISAGMILAKLPKEIIPTQTFTFPVTVLRANAPVTNYVQVVGSAGESGVLGVTITNAGKYLGAIPTYSTTGPGTGLTLSIAVGAVAATVQNPGIGNYAPGDHITVSGGAIFDVTTTKVVAATSNNAGTGGTPGAAILTGTTGTGTKFQVNVVIGGGGSITSVGSFVTGGAYTTNPTLTGEPVTGGGLTGATLNLTTGVNTVTVDTASAYTSVASNPIAQSSSTGSGTGATLNVSWSVLNAAVTNPGTGYTSASALVFQTGTITATGTLTLEATELADVVLLNQPTANDVVCLDGCNFFTKSYS